MIKAGFRRTAEELYFALHGYNRNNIRNWTEAEATYQGFGPNVHLATLDIQQVGIHMLCQTSTTDRTIYVAP